MLCIYIISFLAMQFDALQQSIKHTQSIVRDRWDYAWHFLYWIFTVGLFCLYGYLAITYIVQNWSWFYDFWHFRADHFIFAGHIILSVTCWQISYKKIWKPYFRRHRYL